jgi:hypothetical protein
LPQVWGIRPDGRLLRAATTRLTLPARDPSRSLERFVSRRDAPKPSAPIASA